jgi:hypothetical protein
MKKTLVVGVGEVGGALAQVLETSGPVVRLDLEPIEIQGPIGVMHICLPYDDGARFESAAAGYIRQFQPELTIINSTVAPGTTRRIAVATGAQVAFSPVRGKHVRMVADLKRYTKFVAATSRDAALKAQDHFKQAELNTRLMNKVETLELAKLAETTYFGVLIAFAQELNRYVERIDGDYFEATSFFEEIEFLPRTRYFPGFVGGHCVIPNILLLRRAGGSALLDAVLGSNERRAVELGLEQTSSSKRGAEANGRATAANR